MLSALSVTFGDSSPKGGATGVSVRPHSLRGVLFYQKQKCSAVQIHDILTGIIVQKPLFLATAHCILRHICFQQSAQSFPACQSLSPWERWHCEAMTERASPARKSRRAAISRLFVRAILSLCLCFSPGILALSGASRQLSQRESLSIPSGSKKLPLSEELEVRFIRTRSFCHLQTHRRWRSGTLPADRRPAGSSSPRRRRRR